MADVAIRAECLGKRYRLGQREPYKTLRETIRKTVSLPFRALRGEGLREQDYMWALRDTSFEVNRGEVLGIIGRNGAGKSTLLKILSRITEPTEGRAEVHGRLGSLLEVGTGFHPELTGRENVYLNGAILGMKRAEIDRKFDEIVGFAEIDKFLDTPVKRYSSGMYVRLAFAVAAHLEPEVLVVDEVLAVGDAAFQKKCLGKMEETAVGGATVLFVSHNMAAIERLCPRSIHLDQGKVVSVGSTTAAISSYLRGIDESEASGESSFPEDARKDAQVRRVRVLDQHGNASRRFSCDEPVVIELILQVHRKVAGLYGYLDIAKADGTHLLISYSHDVVPNPLDRLPEGVHSIKVTVPPRVLGHGDYTLYASFASGSGASMIDVCELVSAFGLDDFGSQRGNDRGGLLSTLLSWDVSSVPSGGLT